MKKNHDEHSKDKDFQVPVELPSARPEEYPNRKKTVPVKPKSSQAKCAE